jgi:anthranilate synthase component I
LVVSPALDEVLAYRGDATHLPLFVELLIDTETPISLYEKLAKDEPYSFLLESAEGGETFGRYSFIGFGPKCVFRFSGGRGVLIEDGKEREFELRDPLTEIERLVSAYRVKTHETTLPRFLGGAVGYLGYDTVRCFEKTPIPEGKALSIPESAFMICERLIIVDHLRHRVVLVDHVPTAGDRRRAYQEASARIDALVSRIERLGGATSIFRIALEDADARIRALGVKATTAEPDWFAAVEKAKEAIRAGEIFQVVLSQRFTVERSIPSFEIYRALRALNPSPYMFHLSFDGFAAVGASPEVLVRLEDGEILLRPIAGTRKRGATRQEDLDLEDELLSDEKELAEHRMLLDLGRNDVGRIAEIGSVEVEHPLHIERYSHVMHIVSDVRGRLKRGASAYDVLRACFPAGTVSGAPKIRAMEIIAGLEPVARGLYSGAVGYFDFSGNMDTCIAIRSLVVEPHAVHAQAGAGIVFDSVPEKEHEECSNKAKATLSAIALAEALSETKRR